MSIAEYAGLGVSPEESASGSPGAVRLRRIRSGRRGFMPDWRGMRVVIDATPLLVRSAGVKNYLYHWILHLRRAAGAATVGTFPRMNRVRAVTHEASVAEPLRTFSGLGALAISNYTGAPLLNWLTRGADVFHASVLVRRPPSRVRLTATVHDLTGFLMPGL